jgi:hypothetical protein
LVKQSRNLGSDDLMTLAGPCHQTSTVEHGHAAAHELNEPQKLAIAGGERDAFAAVPQYGGEELLGHRQLIGLDTIQAQQQLATQALLHGVHLVTNRGLRDLRHQSLHVAQRQALEHTTAPELVCDDLSS